MYHPLIIQRSQEKLEERLKLKLVRHSLEEVEAWVAHLDKRRTLIAERENAKVDDINSSNYRRFLKPEENEFITNELLLSSIDFSYWSERYSYILFDPAVGGGMKRFKPWGPQIILLSYIANLELEQTEAYEKGEAVKGILIALHKARQLGASAICRVLLIHRLTTGTHLRAVTASVSDEKVLALYERDQRIITNLPWWMAPHIGFEEKGQHITWDRLDTTLLYQELVQKTGIAQGEQYELGHITEAASDPYDGFMLKKDYFPTIPQAPWVLHIMETTAQGRDNWWRFFVDETSKGLSRWKLVFIPWYAEPGKYRMTPPPGWNPSQDSLQHAAKVYETSKEYVGKQVILSRENLYWYEFSKADAIRNDSLALFLTNYCCTPAESFQHTSPSVFPADLLDYYRNMASSGVPYSITTSSYHSGREEA